MKLVTPNFFVAFLTKVTNNNYYLTAVKFKKSYQLENLCVNVINRSCSKSTTFVLVAWQPREKYYLDKEQSGACIHCPLHPSQCELWLTHRLNVLIPLFECFFSYFYHDFHYQGHCLLYFAVLEEMIWKKLFYEMLQRDCTSRVMFLRLLHCGFPQGLFGWEWRWSHIIAMDTWTVF